MDFEDRLPRRRILAWSAALGAAALPRAVWAAAPKDERSLRFYNLHTGETLNCTYWADGHDIPAARREIDHILRDFRTDETIAIDIGLLDTLVSLQALLDNPAPFNVISGYRSPQTNAALAQNSSAVAKKSYHTKGLAIDVRLPGSPLEDLRSAALSLRRGGVGYYPRSEFVHIDVGPLRAW